MRRLAAAVGAQADALLQKPFGDAELDRRAQLVV
jgi:hypothetical protein